LSHIFPYARSRRLGRYYTLFHNNVPNYGIGA
jgi:hypothetical protein